MSGLDDKECGQLSTIFAEAEIAVKAIREGKQPLYEMMPEIDIMTLQFNNAPAAKYEELKENVRDTATEKGCTFITNLGR